MSELRVSGVEPGVLLLVPAQHTGPAPAGRAPEPFRLPVTDEVHAALRACRRVGESALSPREIQDRLRSGASIAQVAQAAGVGVDRVERWAGPIYAERAQAIALAQATRYARPPDGALSGPLGRLVTAHLDRAGLIGQWDAWRAPDGSWTVEVAHPRARAQWRFEHGRLEALDPHAEALGFRPPPASVPGRRDAGPGPGHADADGAERPRTGAAPPGRRSAVPSWDDILGNAPPPHTLPS